MYEVGVVEQFEAAHSLKGDFGPATRKHGHTYRAELSVRGDRLRDDGTLCDIGGLSKALRDAVDRLHYRDLDNLEAFAHRNSTVEVVADHLLGEVLPMIDRGQIKLVLLRVWESPNTYAGVERLLG